MSTGLLVQYAVIAVLVVASLLQVVRKLAPGPTRRGALALSMWLSAPTRSHVLQALGRRIKPHGGADACGDCGTCGNCPPPRTSKNHSKKVDFHTTGSR